MERNSGVRSWMEVCVGAMVRVDMVGWDVEIIVVWSRERLGVDGGWFMPRWPVARADASYERMAMGFIGCWESWLFISSGGMAMIVRWRVG